MTANASILLVDDDEEFRDILARRFLRRGLMVIAAGDVQEALDAVGRQCIEVAVVDRSLAGGDGLQLIARLKAVQPELQVIMLSGHGDPASVEEARKQGAFEYLVKPCALADLEQVIGRALGIRPIE